MINSETQHVQGQLDLLRKDLFDILKRGVIDGDERAARECQLQQWNVCLQ